MDHARFCRGVVFRGVPGMNTAIIGAVRALCDNAPIDLLIATLHGSTPSTDPLRTAGRAVSFFCGEREGVADTGTCPTVRSICCAWVQQAKMSQADHLIAMPPEGLVRRPPRGWTRAHVAGAALCVFGVVCLGLADSLRAGPSHGTSAWVAAPHTTAPHAVPGAASRPPNRSQARMSTGDGRPPPAAEGEPPQAPGDAFPATPKAPRRQAESTDAVATFLTRRFGIAGGLAWLGILTFGVVSEQIKTRLEVKRATEGTKDVVATEVTTASGLRYTDLRVGGGEEPVAKGLILAIRFTLREGDRVVLDTKARGKGVAFIYGTRPYSGGMCRGLEEALATMRAGGIRRLTVPPELGFGEDGAVLPGGGVVDPGATLEYEVELVRVSIPPS